MPGRFPRFIGHVHQVVVETHTTLAWITHGKNDARRSNTRGLLRGAVRLEQTRPGQAVVIVQHLLPAFVLAREFQPGHHCVDVAKIRIAATAHLVEDLLHPGRTRLGRGGDEYIGFQCLKTGQHPGIVSTIRLAPFRIECSGVRHGNFALLLIR